MTKLCNSMVARPRIRQLSVLSYPGTELGGDKTVLKTKMSVSYFNENIKHKFKNFTW